MKRDEIERLFELNRKTRGVMPNPLEDFRREIETRRRAAIASPLNSFDELRRVAKDLSQIRAVDNNLLDNVRPRALYPAIRVFDDLISNIREGIASRTSRAAELGLNQSFRDAIRTTVQRLGERDLTTLKQLQDFNRFTKDLVDNRSQINTEFITSTNGWRELGSSFRRQHDELARSPIAAIEKHLGILAENERWQSQISKLEGLSGDSILSSNLYRSAATFQESVTRLTEGILNRHGTDLNVLLSQAVMQPSFVYSNFSRRTIGRIAKEKNELDRLAYSHALRFAEDQVIQINSSLTRFIPENPIVELKESSHALVNLNLFEVQRRELKQRSHEFVDKDFSAEEASISGSISAAANRCFNKLVYLNQNAQMKGFGEIFSPTSKTVQSAANLPLICAQTIEQLATVVDYLFFTFYEGAGADKLRFIEMNLVTPDESTPVFLVKHLRNKWLRHDVEHGSAGNIRSKFREISTTLNQLGQKNIPRSKIEFAKVNLNLLRELEAFLDLLIERLDNKEH